jgi:T5SS/PEP-CTERM-associated repeat protein
MTRRAMRGRWVNASVAAAAALASPSAQAFDRFWGGFTSGVFTDPARWLAGGVPGAGDAAVFRVFGGTPAPYTVTMPGARLIDPPAHYVNQALRVGPNTVTLVGSTEFTRGPTTYTLTSGIVVGEGTGPTTLTSNLAVLASPDVSVGGGAGSAATLNVNANVFNVTGGGTGTAGLRVGDAGPGTLNVNVGARVNVTSADGNVTLGVNPGVTGTVNVTGAGSALNLSGGPNAAFTVGLKGAGTLNVSGGGSATGLGIAPLVIGAEGLGTLAVSDGGQVDFHRAVVGQFGGSEGAVTVSGAGSAWRTREGLTVGLDARGLLTVSNGGLVSSEFAGVGMDVKSDSRVIVTGAGSLWRQVTDLSVGGTAGSLNGGAGTGRVDVTLGGRLETGGEANIGLSGPGVVNVDGAGSRWSAGTLNAARAGRVNVTAGGEVSANTATVQGRMEVAGVGSAVRVADQMLLTTLAVGATSTAGLGVVGGGRVENRVAFVGGGAGFGGVGTAFIDQVGSAWDVADQFYVGFAGRGDVTVARGARLTSRLGELGVILNSVGAVTVDGAGSTWANEDNLDVGVAGTGQLTVSNGGVVSAGGLLAVGPRGTVQGNSVVAADVRNGGTIAPGVANSIVFNEFLGSLRIGGDFRQTAGGTFDVEVGSTTLHDRLVVDGTATLAGVLRPTLVNGFTPVPGDRFTVLSSSARTGTVITPPTLGPVAGPRLVPIYTPTDVVLLTVGPGETTWGVDAGGSSSVGGNWAGGHAPGTGGGRVAFTTAITGNRTVTVDAPFTAEHIYFDDDNAYTVQGTATITLDSPAGAATVALRNAHGNGAHAITAPLAIAINTTVDVAGAGNTLRLTGPMTAAAGVTLGKTGPGTLAVTRVRTDGLEVSGGAVRVESDGGAGGTSKVKSLTVAAAARLDLGDNDLLIDYTGAAPYVSIRAMLAAGLNGGAGGITSAAAQASGRTAHGVVDNAKLHLASWNGIGIDDSTLIVRYTLRGDANVDGAVNFADLVALAQNYDTATGQATWAQGDFNYDGNVNFTDLVGLAQNYDSVLLAGPVTGAPGGFDAALASAWAAVPEPSGAPVVAAGMALASGRRRRGRRA